MQIIAHWPRTRTDRSLHAACSALPDLQLERVVVKLAPEMQAIMVETEPDAFEPITGSWGARGWTSLDLCAAKEETLRNALLAAWRGTAPLGLVARLDPLSLL